MSDTTANTFRMSFWQALPSWTVMAVGPPTVRFVVNCLSWGGIRWPTAKDGTEFAVSLMGWLVVYAVGLLFYYRSQGVRLSADGIHYPNMLGFWGQYPWASAVLIERRSFGGRPYLRVRGANRLQLWVCLTWKRLPEFTAKVREYAGEDHPMYQALRTAVEKQVA